MCSSDLCRVGRVSEEHTVKGQESGSNKVERRSWSQERRRQLGRGRGKDQGLNG